MKYYIALIFLCCYCLIYSQNIKDDLQGDWVCTQIIDPEGNKTVGKFGVSDEFLKFSFVKNNLFIIEAPFDKGVKLTVEYGKDYIDLFPGAVYDLPERIYTVESVDESELVLTTYNNENQLIKYQFKNQGKLVNDLSVANRFMDIGYIAIKHQRSSADSPEANRVSEYMIKNNFTNLQLSPTFIHPECASFGDYFSINFKFPSSYKLNKISDELVVDFNVTKHGLQDIKIIKGLDEEMDAALIKTLKETAKKWKAVTFDDQIIVTTMRLHFIFYLGYAKMPNIFI